MQAGLDRGIPYNHLPRTQHQTGRETGQSEWVDFEKWYFYN